MTRMVLALVLLASAVFGMVGAQGLRRLNPAISRAVSWGVSIVYILLLFWRPDAPWLSNASVLAAGCSIGFLFGGLLNSSAGVLAFLTTAAVVDLYSFSGGLTARILEAYHAGGSTLLTYLAVFVELGGRELAVIGVSDIAILVAAYLGLSRSTGLAWEPGLWLLLGLLAAFLVGVLHGGAPGLPFLAGAAWIFALLPGRRAKVSPGE